MNVVFRVDASNLIGTGHVMRCLTLAESLRARGMRVRFICREHIGHLFAQLKLRAIPVTILPGFPMGDIANDEDYAAWLSVTQAEDAEQTISALKGEKPDFLVVDHYGLDIEWERRLRPHAHKIMVVDDLANRTHDCDVLLDQNYSAEGEKRYEGLVPEKCQILVGTRYALLRSEYVTFRKTLSSRDGNVKRVLVFLGGSDPHDLTGMTLDALCDPDLIHLEVDVVVGTNYLYHNSLKKLAGERQQTVIYGPRPHLADLMARADLAIGAGGATTWERMCLGLPTVLISIAANQRPASEALAKAKLVHYAGHYTEVNTHNLKLLLVSVIKDLSNHVELTELNQIQVDGLGVLRVGEVLFPSSPSALSLRPTCEADIIHYFNWDNSSDVLSLLNYTSAISWERYKEWFKNQLTSANNRLFVLEAAGLPVGQICFHDDAAVASIDYSLDVIVQARGWYSHLINLGSKMMRQIAPIRLSFGVKTDNTTSSPVFLRIAKILPTASSKRFHTIGILSDQASWMNEYIIELQREWLEEGHSVLWTHDNEELLAGDFCFYLSCGQIVPKRVLSKFRHNLVVHESDLPAGKGWSPLTWQILEGLRRVPVTLLEAVEEVDSGDIYAQEWLNFNGHELVDDLRRQQVEATSKLCKRFVREYPEILKDRRKQVGVESFYSRRQVTDSVINPSRSIESQFNLLRVVDNDRYPAFFEHQGQRYSLNIKKMN